MIDLSFQEKKEKKELLKKEISEYFSEALEKLPIRYSEYLAGIESSKDIFAGYILEYIEILNKGKNLEILNIQSEEQESSEKIEKL